MAAFFAADASTTIAGSSSAASFVGGDAYANCFKKIKKNDEKSLKKKPSQ
jgi:hypothetical protein